MSDMTTQQNTADRSSNEDSTSVPTSAVSCALLSYWRRSLSFSSLKRILRLAEVESLFSYPLAAF